MEKAEIERFCDALREKMLAESESVTYEARRGIHRKPDDVGMYMAIEPNGTMTVEIRFKGGAHDTEQQFSDTVNRFLAEARHRV